MAKVVIPKQVINVPDGELCNGCRYKKYGEIWCKLFNDYIYETEDYTGYIKCKDCPRS